MTAYHKAYLITGLAILCAVVLVFIEPIPQDKEYHDFSDGATLLGIPNFWNVISNLPFLLVGILGLGKPYLIPFRSRHISITVFIGIILTCLGSAYYHWNPNNFTLMYDRMPMALVFMPFFALLVHDFVGPRFGRTTYMFLVPLGLFSVLYWYYAETFDAGDLRMYAWVQFFPMLTGLVMLIAFPFDAKYKKYVWLILGLYVIAKLFEHFDWQVHAGIALLSGHTLKHLFAALATWYMVKLCRYRKELPTTA